MSAIRKLVLLIFLFGTLSVGVELLLLGHVESFWQLVPLVLIAASPVALVFHVVARNAASIKIFQLLAEGKARGTRHEGSVLGLES